jgi:hypothetical protein
MQLVISSNGTLRCIYGEAIDLHALGQPDIRRASHVEPDGHGQWTADLRPAGGPMLGPFFKRSDALAAENQWLETHWLTPSS